MFFPKKFKSVFVAFGLLIITSFIPGLLHSQNGSYLGIESNITKDEFIAKAESVDFGDKINTTIHKDEKNTYYAINISKLPSQFEKIRILELIFGDKNIVNIGSDINGKYYFFLVNNTLNKTSDDIDIAFEEYRKKSKEELEMMNDEQLRLWLIQHDKYSKN